MGKISIEASKAARAAAALRPALTTYEEGHLVCETMAADEMTAAVAAFDAQAWIAARKAAAKADLAKRAEQARQRYISDGAGKAAVYGLKREEARRWALTAPQDRTPQAFPWIAARAVRLGVPLSEVADEWADKANAWETVGRAIEDAYEAAVEDVEALADSDAIESDLAAIVQGVTWP